eukprot:10624101-Lingulodinium_polyedra.AAC.1
MPAMSSSGIGTRERGGTSFRSPRSARRARGCRARGWSSGSACRTAARVFSPSLAVPPWKKRKSK